MNRFPLLALAGVLASAAHAQVTVTKQDYEGWSNCYRISNASVDLVVVPQIGRVMRYGFVGDRNLLWENTALTGKVFAPNPKTWRNYGGDKLWASPQSSWNWPPDPTIDGSPWDVQQVKNGVLLRSKLGKQIPIRFRRQITLSESGSDVTFLNSLEYQGIQRRPLGVWQITQIDDPDSVALTPEITPQQPKGWYGFGNESLEPGWATSSAAGLSFKRNPKESRKFGVRSSTGIIAATKGAIKFTTESKLFRKANYPDMGSAQEAYFSADPYPYVEVEQLGPLTAVDAGQVIFQSVTWHLSKD